MSICSSRPPLASARTKTDTPPPALPGPVCIDMAATCPAAISGWCDGPRISATAGVLRACGLWWTDCADDGGEGEMVRVEDNWMGTTSRAAGLSNFWSCPQDLSSLHSRRSSWAVPKQITCGITKRSHPADLETVSFGGAVVQSMPSAPCQTRTETVGTREEKERGVRRGVTVTICWWKRRRLAEPCDIGDPGRGMGIGDPGRGMGEGEAQRGMGEAQHRSRAVSAGELARDGDWDEGACTAFNPLWISSVYSWMACGVERSGDQTRQRSAPDSRFLSHTMLTDNPAAHPLQLSPNNTRSQKTSSKTAHSCFLCANVLHLPLPLLLLLPLRTQHQQPARQRKVTARRHTLSSRPR
eukprot:973342-Rhodomonas_salina.1